jgi:DNA polymerase-3 subunit delta
MTPFHFFTGENDYALSKELSRWKQQFSSKHGGENLLILKAKDSSMSDLLDAVSTMPFIAEKRLVIMEGVPRIDKEDFQQISAGIHPQTVLVFADPKPDKRLGIVKEVEKSAEVKRFPLLSASQLHAWIQSHARSLESTITPEALKLLLSIIGSDQWTLDSELKKLAAFADGDIKREHVEALAVPSGSQVIWRLTDLIGSKKADEALVFLTHRIERGEDPYGMWVILLNMIKNLAMMSAAVLAGHDDERGVSAATGIHPFIVRGLLPLSRSMDLERVKSLVDWATEADIRLKTGGYHSSADHPGEVIALAERAILMCR